MKKVIGVMGSASGDLVNKENISKARKLGEAIAKKGCVLLTGAGKGLPNAAAEGAKKEKGFVIGISPAENIGEHKSLGLPYENYDVMVYTGFGFRGRNVLNIRSSDAVVFVAGRTGSLNEFTIAHEEGKVVGILEGSGGMCDNAKQIVKICGKERGARIFYSKDPEELVEMVLGQI